MPIVKRVLVRAALRRIARESDGHSAEPLVNRVLGTRRMLDALNSRIDVMAMQSPPSIMKFGDGKLLDWLLAHRQEIIEFIKEIVRLFG